MFFVFRLKQELTSSSLRPSMRQEVHINLLCNKISFFKEHLDDKLYIPTNIILKCRVWFSINFCEAEKLSCKFCVWVCRPLTTSCWTGRRTPGCCVGMRTGQQLLSSPLGERGNATVTWLEAGSFGDAIGKEVGFNSLLTLQDCSFRR